MLGLQPLSQLPLHHALANMQSAFPKSPALTDPAPLWGRKSRGCSGGFQGALPLLWFVQAGEVESNRGLTPFMCPQALTSEEALRLWAVAYRLWASSPNDGHLLS